MDSDIPTFEGNLIVLLIVSLRRTIFSSNFKQNILLQKLLIFLGLS